MKVKITLLLMAAIALTSLNSCAVRVGGHVRVPREHRERRGRGDRNFIQPQDNGLKNSFAPKESLWGCTINSSTINTTAVPNPFRTEL